MSTKFANEPNAMMVRDNCEGQFSFKKMATGKEEEYNMIDLPNIGGLKSCLRRAYSHTNESEKRAEKRMTVGANNPRRAA